MSGLQIPANSYSGRLRRAWILPTACAWPVPSTAARIFLGAEASGTPVAVKASEQNARRVQVLHQNSGHHLLDHLAAHIRKPEFAAEVAIGQLGMVHAEAVQHSCLQIVNMDSIFNSIDSQLISFADRLATFDPAPRHPYMLKQFGW